MTSSAQKLFYALLGGGPIALPAGECPPYTLPPNSAANIDLDKPMLLVDSAAADINLCEAFV